MRFVVPVVTGVVGCLMLLSLGVWQVQRLAWKEAILSEIAARIGADPVALPELPREAAHRYLPVRVAGQRGAEELHVLASIKDMGAVYRVIATLETGQGRRVMVDLGAIATTAKDAARPPAPLTVTGNLHWPDEVDGFTPAPDTAENIWFARDVPAMAAALDAAPVLVVARTLDPPLAGVRPVPLGVEGIPNNHLQYAITWFSLAAVWAGMTAFFLWRMRRPGPARSSAKDPT